MQRRPLTFSSRGNIALRFLIRRRPVVAMDPSWQEDARRAVRMGLLLAERSINALLPPPHHWGLAIQGTAHGQRAAVGTAATLPVFVLSVLVPVGYHKRLWPAATRPALGVLLLVLVPPRVHSQCMPIPTALARHLLDALPEPLVQLRPPAPVTALLVVFIHLVLELAPVHFRHGHVCYHLTIRILVEIVALLARAASAGR